MMTGCAATVAAAIVTRDEKDHMVTPMHILRRPQGLPGAGAKTIWIGDSITTGIGGTAVNSGKYVAKLASQNGWLIIGDNMVTNASFETDTSIWIPNRATLTSDATHGGSSVTVGAGAKAMKIVPTVDATFSLASPEGDTGAVRLGLQAGVTYTYAADVYVPVGTTGSINLSIFDNDGTGLVSSDSAVVVPANGWQRISVTRTMRAGITDAFCRVNWTGGRLTDAIWVDAVQLQGGATLPAWTDSVSSTVPPRPAEGGTTLQSTDAAANSFQGNIAARYTNYVTAAGGVDLVSLYMGTNDLTDSGYVNWGPTSWRAALDAALQAIIGAAPNAQVVVLSLGYTTTNDATAIPSPWPGGTRAKAYAGMNQITEQAAHDYGAVWVDITGMPAADVDGTGIHPNQAGHDYIVTQFYKAFGR